MSVKQFKAFMFCCERFCWMLLSVYFTCMHLLSCCWTSNHNAITNYLHLVELLLLTDMVFSQPRKNMQFWLTNSVAGWEDHTTGDRKIISWTTSDQTSQTLDRKAPSVLQHDTMGSMELCLIVQVALGVPTGMWATHFITFHWHYTLVSRTPVQARQTCDKRGSSPGKDELIFFVVVAGDCKLPKLDGIVRFLHCY